jgi:hypothetical protein
MFVKDAKPAAPVTSLTVPLPTYTLPTPELRPPAPPAPAAESASEEDDDSFIPDDPDVFYYGGAAPDGAVADALRMMADMGLVDEDDMYCY